MMAKIVLKNATVEYPIFSAGSMSFRNALVKVGTGGIIERGTNNVLKVRALSRINLEINEGDRVGLTGHNGAGKSTLLRTLAGIFPPTYGIVQTTGSIANIFDLGAGIEPEISGSDNVVRLAMFAGATKKQAQTFIPDVAEFAELGNFLEMPVHTYSAGMVARLAFAVATAARPSILLVDEVLGAGDADFQQRAKQRIDSLIESSKIFVLASHSEEMIAHYCNRVLRLEHGEIVEDRRC